MRTTPWVEHWNDGGRCTRCGLPLAVQQIGRVFLKDGAYLLTGEPQRYDVCPTRSSASTGS